MYRLSLICQSQSSMCIVGLFSLGSEYITNIFTALLAPCEKRFRVATGPGQREQATMSARHNDPQQSNGIHI